MIKDSGAQGLKTSIGLNTDENSYFVNTKRIRISIRVAQRLENQEGNLEQDQSAYSLEKKEVNVHIQCLKQLELARVSMANLTSNKRICSA